MNYTYSVKTYTYKLAVINTILHSDIILLYLLSIRAPNKAYRQFTLGNSFRLISTFFLSIVIDNCRTAIKYRFYDTNYNLLSSLKY